MISNNKNNIFISDKIFGENKTSCYFKINYTILLLSEILTITKR